MKNYDEDSDKGYIFEVDAEYPQGLHDLHSDLPKTNALLHLINNQPDIDKIYLYGKDPYEAKYQYLINKRESTELKHFNDPKAFIEYSNHMQDVYKKY